MTGSTTVTSHFSNSSDNPTWAEQTNGGTPTTSRYLDALDGDLGAALTGTSVALTVANPHGDIVSTVTVPTTGDALGIDAWSTYDENGSPPTGAVGA